MSPSRILAPVLVVVALGAAGRARAQPVDRRYLEAPTGGVALPATPLGGDQDARATSVNPAGLWFLAGPSVAVVAGLADEARADAAGAGLGFFAGGPIGGGLLPRLAWGAAAELLTPPRTRVLPDPSTPARLSLAIGLPLGPTAALGATWHHFVSDGALGGVDGVDLGLSARFGNAVWAGAVVRDVNGPEVAAAAVERRYELELGLRPTGTDALALAAGGRIGEAHGDLDGWARGTVRLGRGAWLTAEVGTHALRVSETTATGTVLSRDRDVRGVVGLELSFGHTSALAWGQGGVDREGAARGLGGGVALRWQAEALPPLQGEPDRLERVELTGGLGGRSLVGVVMRLRALERDPHVLGVVFAIDGLGAGMASAEELRDGILRLKKAGKKTFAYLVTGTGRDYWVASACDQIYVDPGGGVRLVGMAGTTLYFKGLFDQLGVQAQFEKIAEYKSAPEAYTETGPSEPALRMRNELYDSMWDDLVGGIAEGRHLDRKAVEEVIAQGPYTAGDLAKDKRLVDLVGEPDAVSLAVVKAMGAPYPIAARTPTRGEAWAPPRVAVVYIDGDIVDGASRSLPVPVPMLGQEMAGSETIIAALTAAREDPRVKAIVVRVDSPGGSALASDLIAREIKKTRGVKPIICSMGDLAASGGYYVSAYCDWIVAEPTTITGSIGIFTGKFDLSGLLDKLGVTTETFRRGPRSDMESYFRPYTDEERQVIHDKLTYLYQRFTGAVAEGRGLAPARVDEIGRGRVWSGAQALPLHLVDQLGGFSDALDVAKRRGGLAPDDVIQLVELPRSDAGLIGKLLGLVGGADERAGAGAGDGGAAAAAAVRAATPAWLRELAGALPLSVIAEPDAPQARLDFSVVWP